VHAIEGRLACMQSRAGSRACNRGRARGPIRRHRGRRRRERGRPHAEGHRAIISLTLSRSDLTSVWKRSMRASSREYSSRRACRHAASCTPNGSASAVVSTCMQGGSSVAINAPARPTAPPRPRQPPPRSRQRRLRGRGWVVPAARSSRSSAPMAPQSRGIESTGSGRR